MVVAGGEHRDVGGARLWRRVESAMSTPALSVGCRSMARGGDDGQPVVVSEGFGQPIAEIAAEMAARHEDETVVAVDEIARALSQFQKSSGASEKADMLEAGTFSTCSSQPVA